MYICLVLNLKKVPLKVVVINLLYFNHQPKEPAPPLEK